MSKVTEKLPGCHLITVVSFWKRLHKDFRIGKIGGRSIEDTNRHTTSGSSGEGGLSHLQYLVKTSKQNEKKSITFAFSHCCCGADELS